MKFCVTIETQYDYVWRYLDAENENEAIDLAMDYFSDWLDSMPSSFYEVEAEAISDE